MNPELQEKILAVTRCGVDRHESTGFFRVALGLYYLSGLMTKETLDFNHELGDPMVKRDTECTVQLPSPFQIVSLL